MSTRWTLYGCQMDVDQIREVYSEYYMYNRWKFRFGWTSIILMVRIGKTACLLYFLCVPFSIECTFTLLAIWSLRQHWWRAIPFHGRRGRLVACLQMMQMLIIGGLWWGPCQVVIILLWCSGPNATSFVVGHWFAKLGSPVSEQVLDWWTTHGRAWVVCGWRGQHWIVWVKILWEKNIEG